MTQSRDANNKHVMFLKLRPELKNIYIYIFKLRLSKTVPLLAALTFIIWMNQKTTGFQAKKTKIREALCSYIYNKANADGVSPHQFPADESVQWQWIVFVQEKKKNLIVGHQVWVTFAATIS